MARFQAEAATRHRRHREPGAPGAPGRRHRALLPGGRRRLRPPGRRPGPPGGARSAGRARRAAGPAHGRAQAARPGGGGPDPARQRPPHRPGAGGHEGAGRPFSSFGPGVLAGPRPAARRCGRSGCGCPGRSAPGRIETASGHDRAGFVDEVARLAAGPGGLSATAREAIGYKEILAHLEGPGPWPTPGGASPTAPAQLARRQRVWFRRDRRIAWIGCRRESARHPPRRSGNVELECCLGEL